MGTPQLNMSVPIHADVKPESENQLVDILLPLHASSQTEASCSIPLSCALGIQENLGQRQRVLCLLSPVTCAQEYSCFSYCTQSLICSPRRLVHLMTISVKKWLCEKTLQRKKVVAKIRNQLFVETGSTVGWFRWSSAGINPCTSYLRWEALLKF